MENPRTEISEEEVEREHAELGLPPVEDEIARPGKAPLMQVVTYLVMAMLFALVAYFLYQLFVGKHERSGPRSWCRPSTIQCSGQPPPWGCWHR